MDNIQIINKGGKKKVVMPFSIYRNMLSALETKEDAQDIKEATRIMARVKAGKETLIPSQVANAIFDDEHPLRAWRSYRKMTAAQLAKKAGISRAYLTQLENRSRTGKLDVWKNIAKALDVDIDILIE